MSTQSIPVITIDGPTASGKGTVTQRVADALGWHCLDSGALYRLTALHALTKQLDANATDDIAQLAASLPVVFQGAEIYLEGKEVSQAIRQEQVGNMASQIAANVAIRSALLQRQRDFRRLPGLVADGRDMGTVVFPDAPLKIFLVADVHARAERRAKQLMEKGLSANLSAILSDMQARDLRDTTRSAAPLVAAEHAYTIDSSALTIDEVVDQVLAYWQAIP